MAWVIWLGVGIVALAGETITTSLILGSFALAAFLVAPLSLVLPDVVQVPLFGAVSLFLLFAVRPAVLRLLPAGAVEDTPRSAGPVGRAAVVVDRVDRHSGEIRIGRGDFWSARSEEQGIVIEPGREVQVVRMEGFTAIVRPLAQGPLATRPESAVGLPAPLRFSSAAIADLESPSEREPSGEVRAFLFADIRGYTQFTHERGDEWAARLVESFVALVHEGVSARGGQVIEVRGDEALAVFTLPRQAIRAAVELQSRFAAASAAHPELPLQVGIGMDAGEVVRVQGGYRGAALNLAARLCSVAGSGDVLISEDLAHLARTMEGLRYVDRGHAQLKGLPAPVRVMQVIPHSQPAS